MDPKYFDPGQVVRKLDNRIHQPTSRASSTLQRWRLASLPRIPAVELGELLPGVQILDVATVIADGGLGQAP